MFMDKCTVLVTGFNWYRSIDGRIFYPNPSGVVAEVLNNAIVDNCVVKSIVLEVDFKSIELLMKRLEDLAPDVVISLGLHPNAVDPLIELTSVNYGYCRSSDCTYDNYLYSNSLLTIPIQIDFKKLIEYIENKGYSVKLSNTTGLYLCNAVAYTIYKYSLEKNKPAVFIHIPPVSDLRFRIGLSINTSWSIDLLRDLVIDIIKYFIAKSGE